MYSKKYQTLQEAYLNFYEGRGSRGETSADSEELARKIARRAKKNPQNTDKYWSGVLRLAGRAPSGSSVIDNAKREFIKKEDLDIVSGYHLDEGEKLFPYGRVGDKLRSLATQMKTAKTPKQKNRIAERQKKINKEYNVPMEQVDLYDIVLSHLIDEGYAETTKAAEVIMENMSDEWMEDILESDAAAAVAARAAKLARQRKGQTPERRKIYRDLATQAGERANPSPSGRDLNNRTGMTADFRRSRRGQSDWNIEHDKPGGITRNPKKLRKQRALGEFGESYNAYDQY